MTKVILDVPAEKMRSFIQLVSKLGIDKHAISSDAYQPASSDASYLSKKELLQKRFPAFLLFDWEFFSNELEFE